jgi:3-oxoacyl-[acyl-carrier protein] reductase
MTISGKVVVVTGGSKGIGKAIALKAAAEGAKVVINYLSDVQAANNVVVGIGNDHALAFQADIAKMEEIARLIDATISRFGQIDVLIPNAAFIPNCSLRTMTEEDFDRAFAVNVKGPCFLAKVRNTNLFAFRRQKKLFC